MTRYRGPARTLIALLVLASAAFAGCSAESESATSAEQRLIDGCSKNEECEDGDPCTQNLCVVGVCVPPLPVLGGHCSTEGGSGGESATPDGAGGKSDGDPEGGTVAVGGAVANGGVHAGGANGQGGTAASGNRTTPGSGAVAGSDAEGARAGEPGTAGANNGHAGRADTDWNMQGGSCSLSTPQRGGGVPVALFSLALAAVAMRRRRRLAALGLAAPLVLSGTTQAAGFAQDTYTAPAAPEDLLWSERAGSDSGHLRPFGRLVLGVADDPLVMVDANDSSHKVRVIDSQFAFYGAFGFGFFHRAHLALVMPLYVQRTGATVDASAIRGARPGDLGFDGRFSILDRHAPLELGLGATLRVPTGDQASFASDGSTTLWLRALLSKQLTDTGTMLNLSVGPLLKPSTHQAGVTLGNELRLTAGALIALTKVLGVTAEAAAMTSSSDAFAKRNTPLEGSLGGRLSFSSLVLGTSIGTGLTKGVGAPDVRWLAMIAVPGAAPEPEPVPVVTNDDVDNDGVHGKADACPAQAEDKDGFEDDDGCPEADNDKDGIEDAADKCPDQAEDKDGFEDNDGCPEADNDKDGIEDAADKCPDQAEDKDGWQDDDGCPEADNDKDGIDDAADKCPNEPETKNGIDDEDGCPDLLRIEQGQIRTLEPIFFDTGKASIQKRSEPLLEEMANLIRTRPDLGVIGIEGYTDSRGAAKRNLVLSKDRAAAVRSYLIRLGVEDSRLTSTGFGSDSPLEDNKTDAGRAKNRRVEFHFGAASSSAPTTDAPEPAAKP